MEEVWRIYKDNEFVAEYDTPHDFNKAWEHLARPGFTYTYGPKYARVPPPLRGPEKPLKRFA